MPPKEQPLGTNPPQAPSDSVAQSSPQPPQVGDIIVPQSPQTPSEASDPVITDTSPAATESQEVPADTSQSIPVSVVPPPEPAPETMSNPQPDTTAAMPAESQPQPAQDQPVVPAPAEQPGLNNPEPPILPATEFPITQAEKPPKRRGKAKALFMVVLLLLIYIGSAGAAYYAGTKNGTKAAEPASITAKANSIQLPKEAIVTAECTPGRGKQYIIPKDIPVGPIYDVKDGNVIAIEYLISLSSLLTQADSFTDKITELTKTYTVDHFKLVPTPAHAGETDQHVHLIMFIVPKSVSESITCDSTTTTDTSMPTTDANMSEQ